ncbi:Gephyrin [Arthrobotrys entomopaga]|nr:Gephyrin [Arthrobotrys entomopaga]
MTAEHISYNRAKKLLKITATTHISEISNNETGYENVKITDAVGRIAAEDVLSPISTPPYDSSAMDGYAVCSSTTNAASPENPCILQVVDSIMAAESGAIRVNNLNRLVSQAISVGCAGICYEIMTGAAVPAVTGGSLLFDAIVKVEDTVCLDSPCDAEGVLHNNTIAGHQRNRIETTPKYILLVKPVPPFTNKRLAGHAIHEGFSIIRRNGEVKSSHVMTICSVGISSMRVRRKLRVAVISTGSELQPSLQALEPSPPSTGVFDSNGPYILAYLSENKNLDVKHLGIVKDDPVAIRNKLLENQGRYDIIITTGGVSAGKHDYVRAALEDSKVSGEVTFHHLKIRPGGPVLFATIPPRNDSSRTLTAVFGLPGNPLAAAACLRFIVLYYIDSLLDLKDSSCYLGLKSHRVLDFYQKEKIQNTIPMDKCTFLLSRFNEEGILIPMEHQFQKSGSVTGLALADGWIKLNKEDYPDEGSYIECFSL